MENLEGRSVVVTGGARGIGAAMARAFSAAGALVTIADILSEEGQRLADELGRGARFVRLDVTEESQWLQVRQVAEETTGQVSILINNAGIVDFGGIEEQDPKRFQRVLDVNLFGPWLGMHVLAPSLIRDGHGVVINVSSTAGLMGYANLGAYVASKWGLRGLTKSAALELAPAGIRVCSIHPGPIRTPMTAGFDDSLTVSQPIPRFGEPEEVAAMAVFIATGATYSTGSEFVVDGGAVAGSLQAVDLH